MAISTVTRADSKADREAAKIAAAKAKADERQRSYDAEIAARKAAKEAALADIEVIGKQITSLVDKINREEDAAVAAWNKHSGESTTFREQLAKVLKDAEPKCKAAGMKIKDLQAKYIGDRLGETQFKQILRVARGAITFQQIKLDEAARKQQQRAAKKVGTNGLSRPTTTTVLLGDGTTAQMPRSAGNDVDAEASAQAMKGAHGAEPGVRLASKRIMQAGKGWLDDNLKDLVAEDKAELFHYFKFHTEMQGVKRQAA